MSLHPSFAAKCAASSRLMCSARLLSYQVHDVLGITSRQFRDPSTGDVPVKISWKSTDPGIKMALVISALVIAATAGCRAEVPFFLGNDQFLVRVATTCDEQLAKFGPRFDSSARVDSIRADGQEFLAQEGLIDEFNQRWVPPPGYNDATSAGNVFMKIGVGLLRRTRITPYRFADTYPIEARATTKLIFRNQMLAIFEQSLPLTDGWGYRYRKSYAVDTRTRRITITYELESLSFKEIEIDQYNHNWPQPPRRPPGFSEPRSPSAQQAFFTARPARTSSSSKKSRKSPLTSPTHRMAVCRKAEPSCLMEVNIFPLPAISPPPGFRSLLRTTFWLRRSLPASESARITLPSGGAAMNLRRLLHCHIRTADNELSPDLSRRGDSASVHTGTRRAHYRHASIRIP